MNLHVCRTEQQHDHIMEYNDLRNEFMIVTFIFFKLYASNLRKMLKVERYTSCFQKGFSAIGATSPPRNLQQQTIFRFNTTNSSLDRAQHSTQWQFLEDWFR